MRGICPQDGTVVRAKPMKGKRLVDYHCTECGGPLEGVKLLCEIQFRRSELLYETLCWEPAMSNGLCREHQKAVAQKEQP